MAAAGKLQFMYINCIRLYPTFIYCSLSLVFHTRILKELSYEPCEDFYSTKKLALVWKLYCRSYNRIPLDSLLQRCDLRRSNISYGDGSSWNHASGRTI